MNRVNPHGPVAFAKLEAQRDGFVRFQLTLRAATEFVLRKDYRADWETGCWKTTPILVKPNLKSRFAREVSGCYLTSDMESVRA